MEERGHSYDDIVASIKARQPDFDAYIEPQKQHADVVIQVLPTQLVKDKESDLLRVRLVQKEGLNHFEPAYLFDEGSTIDWRPCGRKLTCSYPGLKMYYGPDNFLGNEVSILEIDGQFDNLEEIIYVESHLSNIGTKNYGEMTELLLKHREYPGSNNGTGLFQVLVGLKMRETYDQLVGTRNGRVAAA
jgi:phosphoribulokinase